MYMYTTNVSIKQWAEDDRPREKMENKGKEVLSNAELLAIILGSGTRNKSAVELAQEILKSVDNNLFQLGKYDLNSLTQFGGIGKAKGITIQAVLELGRRRVQSKQPAQLKINQAKEVYQLTKQHYENLDHEEFRVLGMSISNNLIRNELVSKGGMSGVIADGRIIFRKLLSMKATSCILIHNHPSGKLSPSQSDIDLTRRFKKFGELIDLQVLDHVIVTDRGYYSFTEENMVF